jgi:hypothetical protein
MGKLHGKYLGNTGKTRFLAILWTFKLGAPLSAPRITIRIFSAFRVKRIQEITKIDPL